MRNTFARLDDVLIERLFQPLSDLVSYRIGVGRGVIVCVCLDIASLSWIVARTPALSDAVAAWDALSGFCDLAFLLLGLVAMISLRTLFRRAEAKQANPLRPAMQPHRAVVLLMLAARLVQLKAAGMSDTADAVMLLFATTALYLGACTQRPPVRRAGQALATAG
jgi:hypothetical protein